MDTDGGQGDEPQGHQSQVFFHGSASSSLSAPMLTQSGMPSPLATLIAAPPAPLNWGIP